MGLSGGLATNGGATVPADLFLAPPVNYYVDPARGSDLFTGRSWARPFASIAGAVAAIGYTVAGDGFHNTNPAIINLAAGTYGSAIAGLANVTVQGAVGLRFVGAGEDQTFLWGPDAAALFTFINCRRCGVDNLTFLGSPAGTGGLAEFKASYYNLVPGAFDGGTQPSRCGGSHTVIGQSGAGPNAGFWAGFGYRWVMKDGNFLNDANNDTGLVQTAHFVRCQQPFSIEGSNSLLHEFNDCSFDACGGGVVCYGGSYTLSNPRFGSSAASGWCNDFQPPHGTSSFPVQTQAIYRHKSTVVNPQGEAGGMGWARSHPAAGATIAGASTILNLVTLGGEYNSGGAAISCTDATTTGTALTSATLPVTQSVVGRTITGTNIPAGTTITAVGPAPFGGVTLSQPATGGAGAVGTATIAAGTGSLAVDWEAGVPEANGGRSTLEFIGTTMRGWFSSPEVFAPDPNSSVKFTNCQLADSGYTWGGLLAFIGCEAKQTFTMHPIGAATYTEVGCVGPANSFKGGVYVAGKSYSPRLLPRVVGVSNPTTPNAVANVNGNVVTITPDVGYTGFDSVQAWSMTTSGMGAETINGTLTATFDDATTATAGATRTTNGRTDGTAGLALVNLSKAGHYIVSISFVVNSSIANSAASAVWSLLAGQIV